MCSSAIDFLRDNYLLSTRMAAIHQTQSLTLLYLPNSNNLHLFSYNGLYYLLPSGVPLLDCQGASNRMSLPM